MWGSSLDSARPQEAMGSGVLGLEDLYLKGYMAIQRVDGPYGHIGIIWDMVYGPKFRNLVLQVVDAGRLEHELFAALKPKSSGKRSVIWSQRELAETPMVRDHWELVGAC